VPTLEGWQISPFYQPAREVGGDFYDFFELDDGRVPRTPVNKDKKGGGNVLLPAEPHYAAVYRITP
jgi:hypothetical protein